MKLNRTSPVGYRDILPRPSRCTYQATQQRAVVVEILTNIQATYLAVLQGDLPGRPRSWSLQNAQPRRHRGVLEYGS